MRLSTFFAAVAIVLAAVIVYLILVVIGFRQRASEIPCGPELVQNGSFESGPNPGIVLLTTRNNCEGTGPCLENWTISGGADKNPLQWYMNENGNPVPRTPEGKQYLDLSGQFHKGLFPGVSQKIHVGAGAYQLRFQLGQGNSPPDVFGPVTVDIGVRGPVTRGQSATFTTDKDGPAWQTRALRITTTDGEIEIVFQAHTGQTTGFIGLDAVSLVQLKPLGVCIASPQ
jgi:hypothetical protein